MAIESIENQLIETRRAIFATTSYRLRALYGDKYRDVYNTEMSDLSAPETVKYDEIGSLAHDTFELPNHKIVKYFENFLYEKWSANDLRTIADAVLNSNKHRYSDYKWTYKARFDTNNMRDQIEQIGGRIVQTIIFQELNTREIYYSLDIAPYFETDEQIALYKMIL